MNFIYSCFYYYNSSFLIIFFQGTDKGNISIFDMLLDKKIGYFYNDFHDSAAEFVHDDFKFNNLNIHKSGKICVAGSMNGTLNIISYT